MYAFLREAQINLSSLPQNDSVAWRVSEMLMTCFVVCCLAVICSVISKTKYKHEKLNLVISVVFNWVKKSRLILLMQTSGL